MSLIKKLAGQTIVYGLGSILPRVLQLIIFLPYLTRVFEDDRGEYGIHSIMYSFAGFLVIFLTFRMETALFRYGNKSGELENTFSTALTTICISTLVALGVILWQAESIANVLTKAEDMRYVQYFAFICSLDVIAAIPFARLRLEDKAIKFSTIKIINVMVNISVMLFFLELLPKLDLGNLLIYEEDQMLAYVFQANLVASSVTVLLLSPVILKNTWRIDFTLLQQMYKYAWPLVIVGVAGVISTMSDRWLINRLSIGTDEQNEIATGLYAAAVKFAVIMQLFIQAFNYAAEPFFFKRANDKGAQQIYADVARVFTFVGSFAFLTILCYLDILQVIFVGEGFRGGLRILPILLLAYLFLGLYYNFSVWYKIKDKTVVGAGIAIAGALISLACNIYLIPKMGIIASAWAAFFTFGSMATMGYFIGRKYYPVPYRMDKIVGLVVLAVVFYFAKRYALEWLSLGEVSTFLFNTITLLSFTLIVWFWERDFYKKIMT